MQCAVQGVVAEDVYLRAEVDDHRQVYNYVDGYMDFYHWKPL